MLVFSTEAERVGRGCRKDYRGVGEGICCVKKNQFSTKEKKKSKKKHKEISAHINTRIKTSYHDSCDKHVGKEFDSFSEKEEISKSEFHSTVLEGARLRFILCNGSWWSVLPIVLPSTAMLKCCVSCFDKMLSHSKA